MTLKLGRLTIELVDDTKKREQPRDRIGRYTKVKKVTYYGDWHK